MANDRSETRLSVRIEVELHCDGDITTCHTRDISNSGVFLESQFVKNLEIGVDVDLKIKNGMGTEEPPLVTAKVVRVESEGFAAKFET